VTGITVAVYNGSRRNPGSLVPAGPTFFYRLRDTPGKSTHNRPLCGEFAETPLMSSNEMKEDRNQAALDYHEFPTPGKVSIAPTKQLTNQSDLALAYSPGVAAACHAIVEDPLNVFHFTVRGNLVGVITDGTAVLGLGAIGPLAAKPVMEGNAVLFKKFAGIDVFDIEIDQRDPQKLVDVIAALEPTFGAINLEDIKAPE
jgi:malate dehydrogenase (oxaloacetate-decarboxylating)(NADP+)